MYLNTSATVLDLVPSIKVVLFPYSVEHFSHHTILSMDLFCTLESTKMLYRVHWAANYREGVVTGRTRQLVAMWVVAAAGVARKLLGR